MTDGIAFTYGRNRRPHRLHYAQGYIIINADYGAGLCEERCRFVAGLASNRLQAVAQILYEQHRTKTGALATYELTAADVTWAQDAYRKHLGYRNITPEQKEFKEPVTRLDPKKLRQAIADWLTKDTQQRRLRLSMVSIQQKRWLLDQIESSFRTKWSETGQVTRHKNRTRASERAAAERQLRLNL